MGVEALSVLLENMYRCGDAARNKVVDTVPRSVRWITDKTPRNAFSPILRRSSGEDIAPEHTELGLFVRSGREESDRNATGEADCASKHAVVEVHNIVDRVHMEFGTDKLCIIAYALSLSVRHGSSALPSVWSAYGAEYCTPTPNRPHI
jgi:hypothetical protein